MVYGVGCITGMNFRRIPNSPPTDEVLERYLSGTATSDETVRIQQWIESHPDWESSAETLGHVLHHMTARRSLDLETARRWVHEIVAEPGIEVRKEPVRQRRFRGMAGRQLWAGAIVTALIGAGAIQWASQRSHPEPRGGGSASFVYVTGKSDRSTISLPDGSQVTLNVASRLEVPDNYDRGNRTLYLKGEAMFVTSHRPGHPFTVIAGPGVAQVLGTTFKVRHYETDTVATVAVLDGKVAVGEVVLTANQLAHVGDDRRSYVTIASDAQFSFAEGILMLDSSTLANAISSIERWYNVQIKLADPELNTRGIQGPLPVTSIHELASTLAFMFDCRVELRGRVLTLHSK